MLLGLRKSSIDKRHRQEQAGFGPGFSCIDHTFTLRSITEECLQYRTNLIIHFVNFHKEFDRLLQTTLWAIIKLYGFQPKKNPP
jgi:hypothetical protein